MAATFIRGLRNLPPAGAGVVATIGTFDGIHRGHQAIMAQVHERAEHYGLPGAAIIFEKHPMEFLLGEKAPARLMRLREKIETIHQEGVERIFCLQFNRKLRAMTASEFVERVLVNGIGVRCLIVGDDFRFGCDRIGNIHLLREVGKTYGFEVIDTATVEFRHRRISSTWVRETLEQGDFALAEQLLGRPFSISGRVTHGEKLGRTIGVPTANVNLKRQRAPVRGVFVVEVAVGDQRLPGVANVGMRPTVGDLLKPILEVHILDWSGDLYGERIQVAFLAKLRDERQFPGIDELLVQIRNDIQQAKAYFAARPSLAPQPIENDD